MKVDWMYHTGFVVSDMERSLAFYRDLLGLQEERNAVLEGEPISRPRAKAGKAFVRAHSHARYTPSARKKVLAGGICVLSAAS